MACGVFIGAQLVAGVIMVVYLMWSFSQSGRPLYDLADAREVTAAVMSNPWLFMLNNLTLAALIPLSMLTVWACNGWRPRWSSSVRPRLHWPLMLASGAVAMLGYAVYSGVDFAVNGVPDVAGGEQVALLLVIILLTTPLQSAGEEYFFRGVLTQAVGSWFSRPLFAVLASSLSTALLFAAVHSMGGEQNFWLFFSRFAIGLINSYLVWRTGGLEAGIALHTVNNWFGLVPAVLAGQLGEALANPPQPALSSLMQIGFVVLVAGGIVLVARAMKAAREHDPSEQPGGSLPPTDCWPAGSVVPGATAQPSGQSLANLPPSGQSLAGLPAPDASALREPGSSPAPLPPR